MNTFQFVTFQRHDRLVLSNIPYRICALLKINKVENQLVNICQFCIVMYLKVTRVVVIEKAKYGVG
jgi:hypothetical protein